MFLLIACTSKKESFTRKFHKHYSKLVTHCTDQYGIQTTPMWLSMWNLESEKYPFDFSHSDSIPCRVYLDRSVDAPGGSTLYWGLPDIAAAVEISERTVNKNLEKASKEYVQSYLEKNTSKNGIILWGNHYYYDVIQDKTLKFIGKENPKPVNFETETGNYHEMRPILPPWELLYYWFPERIKNHIREVAKLHTANPETGEFNRHANQKSEYAFIESGSILVYSLTFLYSKTGDEKLLEHAESILNYSFSNQNAETGLVINSPSRKRWDQFTSTTEIGLWGLNILKASDFVSEKKKKEWVEVVEKAVKPWLENGFDNEKGMFYGSLNVRDAKPVLHKDDYPYKPQTYADIWNPLFPTHNYPMQFAECCLELYKITNNYIYQDASDKWYRHVLNQLENRKNYILYAENYARIIHFLNHYGIVLNNINAQEMAKQLANKATSNLFVEKSQMFRSHTKEMRYDVVDGVGLLYFPLQWIETGIESRFGGVFF